MQAGDSTSFTRKAPPHLAINSVVTENDLDSDTAIKSGTLTPFIDGPHTTDTDAPDNIIIAKLPAFQRQHQLMYPFLIAATQPIRGCGSGRGRSTRRSNGCR